jgi:hypothetical protein
VVAVFLVGCAVGGVSSQLVVPKASAQQAALPASEYLCLERGADAEGLSAAANKLAVQRWELAESLANIGVWCWKRPKL